MPEKPNKTTERSEIQYGEVTMYDVEDEWEYGEKRAQVQAMLEELMLDAIIEALAKIKQRNEWINQGLRQSQEEVKF